MSLDQTAKLPKDYGNRRDFRIRLNAVVRYKIAKRFGAKFKLSPTLKGLGVDFSAGGAAIKTGKDIPKKYLLHLEIFFPFGKQPVSAVAEVIRTKKDTLKEKPVFLCMVRYLLIDPAVQDKMTGYFINQGSRENKDKSA